MRSDRKAQEYTLYDDGASFDGKEKGGKSELRCELLHVNFSNSLRNRNPGAMTVVVPEVDSEGGMVPARPKDAAGQLNERLKHGDLGGLMELKNREPKWNPTSNMYQLDFHGRATLASCKNIQLHPKHGEQADVSFLMGKVEENKFNVDFKAPFSALQAFAFALIVFDNSSGSFRASGWAAGVRIRCRMQRAGWRPRYMPRRGRGSASSGPSGPARARIVTCTTKVG